MASMLFYALLAVAAALLGLTFLRELRDERTEDAVEAAEKTGKRTREAVTTGSAVTTMGIVGFGGLLADLGMQALALGAGLNEVLGGAPVILGHLIAGIIGYLGVSGVLTVQQWGFAFILITVTALILRFSNDAAEGA